MARRPKDWIDTEPEEQVQGNVAGMTLSKIWIDLRLTA